MKVGGSENSNDYTDEEKVLLEALSTLNELTIL